MHIKTLPKQEELLAAFDYDSDTGTLSWKYHPTQSASWNGKFAFTRAGTNCIKSRIVYFNGISYPEHRIIWVLVNGDCLNPETQIDHRDCDPFNNRILNLRKALHEQNGSNSRLRIGKKLPKGVSIQTRGGYRSRIGISGSVFNLGTFRTPEEAHEAYIKAAVRFKKEFAR